MSNGSVERRVRYEAQEPCPPLTALVVGGQGAVLLLAPTVLIVTIAIRAAGLDDAYLTWAVFAALLINAAVTALQARPVWRFGAGSVMIALPTAFYIGISAAAVQATGPATLASLLVVCSIVPVAMARWLPVLRHVVTPLVLGTVLILVPLTILPFAFDSVRTLGADTDSSAGPIVAGASLLAFVVVSLGDLGRLRTLAPLIGIGLGCLAALPFGAIDLSGVAEASWFGLPEIPTLGFDLTPGREFWALLPTFAVLTFVQGMLVVSQSAITQQASARRERAVDFRQVQGAVGANGIGMLLAGIAGTPPTSYLASVHRQLVEQTGVASRRAGIGAAIVFVAFAFCAKLTALMLSIPGPVVGAYLMLVLGLFFVEGIRAILRDGLDRRQAMVVTVSLTLGFGLHQHPIMSDLLGEPTGRLAANGVMIGALVAIVGTRILETLQTRHARLQLPLDMASLPAIDAFLTARAERTGWNAASARRLRSAGEEALTCLLEQAGAGAEPRRLTIRARPQGNAIALEFVAAAQGGNIEDQLALLPTDATLAPADELSLRLLSHYASLVRHQQFHGVDVLTLWVEARDGAGGGPVGSV